MSLFLFLWSVNARDDEDEPVAHHRTPLLINRLYVFGDSNVDPGNSMKVVDPYTNRTTKVGLTADFPPYGIDFDKKSMATGRFSNGKTAADCLEPEEKVNTKLISLTKSLVADKFVESFSAEAIILPVDQALIWTLGLLEASI
ncbi:hypothetical protein Vadar_029191 [Vaccinium darrowii]|uniref:Uncharacterized protein n=1 Tax=Vaccinium darrowii TaxID=229202 RepID=A0ACB7XKR4_9ERIC|nr:hypothetical protein Vadar_029191 [Vaccinium darrowii]